MKIRKITLSKYKRFQSLTIDLGDNPKRIVALVGPNGCGKSSVFDGMLFLNNAYGGIGNKGNKDFHYHSIEQNPSYDYRNVSIQFLAGDYYTIRSQKEIQGKQNTIFSFRSPYRYNNNLKITRSQAVSEIRLNNYELSHRISMIKWKKIIVVYRLNIIDFCMRKIANQVKPKNTL